LSRVVNQSETRSLVVVVVVAVVSIAKTWRIIFFEKKNKQLPQLMSFIENFSWEVNN
jgi:hypothetical protein